MNPYQMLSTGALLIAAADGEGLVQKMALEGIPIGGDWADDIREGEDSPERGRGPVSG